MTPNQDVFCNSPWYELHIYWNGDYGFCCSQFDPPYDKTDSAKYNITNLSIREWHNSQPMRDARLRMFSDDKWKNCSACWSEERSGGTSRRHRSNQKSVLFRQNFSDSFTQSPNFVKFKESYDNDGVTSTLPIDLHIDLGNYCNLACKMCWSGASSKIATQEKKWGTLVNQDYLGQDWTKDSQTWNKFLDELATLPLKNIHFMGGETLIQPRFSEFVDVMIDKGRTDLNFSFVTNGTTFNKSLMDKLSKFNRVGIEVSIETTTETNAYVRQGTDTVQVLRNLDLYSEYCNDNISVTVRPAISALTIRDFHTLLRHCLDKKFLVKGLIVDNPTYMHPSVLPKSLREQYKKNYLDLISTSNLIDINESDPHNYDKIISIYANRALQLLDQPESGNISELVDHMTKWDKIYDYDARVLYPELTDILTKHEYQG